MQQKRHLLRTSAGGFLAPRPCPLVAAQAWRGDYRFGCFFHLTVALFWFSKSMRSGLGRPASTHHNVPEDSGLQCVSVLRSSVKAALPTPTPTPTPGLWEQRSTPEVSTAWPQLCALDRAPGKRGVRTLVPRREDPWWGRRERVEIRPWHPQMEGFREVGRQLVRSGGNRNRITITIY